MFNISIEKTERNKFGKKKKKNPPKPALTSQRLTPTSPPSPTNHFPTLPEVTALFLLCNAFSSMLETLDRQDSRRNQTGINESHFS